MSIQTHRPENERISKYVGDRINESNIKLNGEKIRVQKIDLLQDPTSNRVKSLKAMLRIDNQIIQLTVESGRPSLFLKLGDDKRNNR